MSNLTQQIIQAKNTLDGIACQVGLLEDLADSVSRLNQVDNLLENSNLPIQVEQARFNVGRNLEAYEKSVKG